MVYRVRAAIPKKATPDKGLNLTRKQKHRIMLFAVIFLITSPISVVLSVSLVAHWTALSNVVCGILVFLYFLSVPFWVPALCKLEDWLSN